MRRNLIANAPPQSSNENDCNLSVLMSHDQPVAKRYFVGESGEVEKQDYQLASKFKAVSFLITTIYAFARLIGWLSRSRHMILLRGIHRDGRDENTWRRNYEFPEHPDGTNWVMLDIDGVPAPDGISPVSQEAVKWLIASKLPPEFQSVTCFYQFSGSAGILKSDGSPLKPGIRVHLFYMLSRRVKGYLLAGYLRRHCIDSGFYTIEANKGGVAQFKHGIDPATIRAASQPHYVARPEIEAGVHCVLDEAIRQGVITAAMDFVELPQIDYCLVVETDRMQKRLREDWMREQGYQLKSKTLLPPTGPVRMTYYVPPGANSTVRTGRPLDHVNAEGSLCILFFSDEGTPGSWYVKKGQPQVAYRYGDGECIPLQELSEQAYAHVRDELKWFTELPGRELQLDENGRVPDFSTFIQAKYSLILAPTGSGKTTRVIDWMRAKSQEMVVVYVAQTIPLVNQMRDDLAYAGVDDCIHYQGFPYGHAPDRGIVVTTNESMPKILGSLTNNRLCTYALIIDEVHIALDDFAKSQKKLNGFSEAIRQASSVLFMTGTFTEIQRLMLSGTIARLHGGSVNEQTYCAYEFAPIKRNPLQIVALSHFRADVVTLLESVRDKRLAGEPIPVAMIMMSSSRMEVFRELARQLSIEELIDIVSRPEYLQEEIEAARVSDRPVLVTSPLFSVGLNLIRQLEILYCRFDHLEADTSRVIQTINRANRGDTPCEVRIYANPSDQPIVFPAKQVVIDEVRDALQAESDSVYNLTDMPVLLDRMSYRVCRHMEGDPNKAIGQLIRDDGFQNYELVPQQDTAVRDKDKTQLFRDMNAVASSVYDQQVLDCLAGTYDDIADCLLWRLRKFQDERRLGYKQEASERRTDREIESNEFAVVMHLCGLNEPAKARKVSQFRLQVLLGDREPWLSDVRSSSRNRQWATEAAKKTQAIVHLINVLQQLASGDLDGFGFAGKINRDKALQASILALVQSERELLETNLKMSEIARLKERVRQSNTEKNCQAAVSASLSLADEFLASIGVYFRVDTVDGQRQTNYAAPIVPSNWIFENMQAKLKHRNALLKALPIEFERVNRDLDPDGSGYFVKVGTCYTCRFFDSACCAVGLCIDWEEMGIETCKSEQSYDQCDRYLPVRQVALA